MVVQELRIRERRAVTNPAVRCRVVVGNEHVQQLFRIFVLESTRQGDLFRLSSLAVLEICAGGVGKTLESLSGQIAEKRLDERAVILASTFRERGLRVQ
ncbi:hypothetical protein D3C72_1586920 [compost metagenome]